MTRIDIHSAALLARQREAEVRREIHSTRLVREAAASVRRTEAAPAPVPIMHAWLRLAAGNRPSGA